MPKREIKILPDSAALAAEAAVRIQAAAADAIARRGSFSIALSGGSTPKVLFQLLAAEPNRSKIDWPKWEIFFGDERCVPPEHPDSNYGMALEAMLGRVPIPAGHIHRMKGEIDPQTAAVEYGRLLKEKFADGGLDVVLLGMGDDGHTASLFPYSKGLEETQHRCLANWVEKFKTWRITLSAPFINRARLILFLVAGAPKAERVKEVLNGPADPRRLPSQLIGSVSGQTVWLLDTAAAARL